MSDTISRDRALRRLSKTARLQEAVATSPFEAIGLVASHNICAFCDVPEAACSVRDGFAVRTVDIEKAAATRPVTLPVTQVVRAESREAFPVDPGCAARVLTGGMVPQYADAVLAEEDVEVDGDSILVRAPVRPGWFVRAAGGEIEKGSIITRKGEVITSQAAAVMIRTRVTSIHAHPMPTVRVIALGSELSDPCCGEGCDTARFPADNLVLTSGLLKQSGAEVVQAGVLPDSETQLVETLSAAELPDVIITTGGTGRSERDFARMGAQDAGFETIFDHVDLRPGRNMFAAHKNNTILFGLPGPPSAVFACYHAIILPFIRRLRGVAERATPLTARVKNGISARPGGQWVVLTTLQHACGELVATPLTSKDMPPMLAIGKAHGVALISGGDSILPEGEVEIASVLYE